MWFKIRQRKQPILPTHQLKQQPEITYQFFFKNNNMIPDFILLIQVVLRAYNYNPTHSNEKGVTVHWYSVL